ncbi:epimerase, partial [Candidatus Woesearchaeota archaeon]|nr:epimerase [Candidatus Woesearchaeota archaeon]
KAVIKDEPANAADVPITYADISKAERLLRWKPTTNIKEGLKKFYDWYLSSPESSS